ncbi:MAG: carboxylating nicotinate-nucleotide diphosphorylase [Bacillota bacterium]|nr:carboxylating nicotinate-nucleotide diphosphorylase [Bacillota bacterium]
MRDLGLEDLIKRALAEDIGHGDITTMSLIPEEQEDRGIFYCKAEGVLAGIDVCQAVFVYLDAEVKFESLKQDGDSLQPGDTIAVVHGKTQTLLTGERVALNFLQRLSGIASKTRCMTEVIRYSKAELLDTRKTTPGLRVLEKYAVNIGGARNHRFGLYDGVMIKDNHIKAVGSIQKAISGARKSVPHTIKIEVEVENLQQLQEAVDARADIILLDNMDSAMMKEAVELVNGRALLEASGGINEENLVEVSKTGVDFISVGALTHSVSSLDISFDIEAVN